MSEQKTDTNAAILGQAMERAGHDCFSQYADYLTEKYGFKVSRQSLYQWGKSDRLTVTHLILRELIGNDGGA